MSEIELINVRMEGSDRVVSFSADDINDLRASLRIGAEIEQLFQSDQSIESLTIDLHEIDWLGSMALNQLISIQTLSRKTGIPIRVMNVSDSAREIFKLTRLERMFDVTPVATVGTGE